MLGEHGAEKERKTKEKQNTANGARKKTKREGGGEA